jgi:hypothetical protein
LMPYGTWTVKSGTVHLRLLKSIAMQGKTYEDRDMITQNLWELNDKSRIRIAENEI